MSELESEIKIYMNQLNTILDKRLKYNSGVEYEGSESYFKTVFRE